MKQTLLHFASAALFLLFTNGVTAQNFQTLPIQSGFNADVVANGVGASTLSTTTDVDGVNYNFVARDFQVTASSTALTYGLPTNGLITSAVATPTGLNYQLASYSGNNSLRLQNTNDTGTLTLASPLAAVNLYLLATSGSGSVTVTVTVNFSDATSETFSNISIADWYNGTNFAIQGIGRINRTNDALETGGGTNPRLYQIPIALSLANQSKIIQSVSITKTANLGIANIMAISAEAYTTCAGPTNITYLSTTDGGTLSWTAPANAPTSGYDYYYSTAATAPTAITTPTGSVGPGITSVTLIGLPTGTTYYFWVRSNCGTDQGFWQMKEFTTGQMVFTYTNGDINTEYNTAVTTASTNSCPGTLTINVPSGYYIVATDVAYTMTTASNGWMSEQRSLLVCTTNNTSETAISSGIGGTTGTYAYNRTGLNIANNLTGNVAFELRAWRTYGGSGCDANYNKVDNNTWKITVTLSQTLHSAENSISKVALYPVPFKNELYINNPSEVRSIAIFNTLGKSIRDIVNPTETIDLSDLESGLYLFTLKMQDGSIFHTKAIKQQ